MKMVRPLFVLNKLPGTAPGKGHLTKPDGIHQVTG